MHDIKIKKRIDITYICEKCEKRIYLTRVEYYVKEVLCAECDQLMEVEKEIWPDKTID